MILKDKNILLAVTGSIAIYKSLELIRLFIKAGANVKVILSDGAKKFINPITFEAISQNRVLDENSESWDKSQNYNHIDITKWADILLIAPATANTINKISCGIADNLLLQTVLACKKKILIAAGSTVTGNVKKGELYLTRAKAKTIDGYFYKHFDKAKKAKEEK